MSEAVRFYFDEHVGHAIAKGLRRRGIDVLTMVEAEMLGAGDEDHVALARSQGRVIVTHDEDFLRLAAKGIDHAGIVYAPQGRTLGAMVRGLMLIAQTMTAEDRKMNGAERKARNPRPVQGCVILEATQKSHAGSTAAR